MTQHHVLVGGNDEQFILCAVRDYYFVFNVLRFAKSVVHANDLKSLFSQTRYQQFVSETIIHK